MLKGPARSTAKSGLFHKQPTILGLLIWPVIKICINLLDYPRIDTQFTIRVKNIYFREFLGGPDGPDPQEAILGSCVLQDEVRSGPNMGT